MCLLVGMTTAQIETPAPSPAQKVEQKIGLTTVTVDYSRPGKKGRVIFGDDGIVNYSKLWRTGANAATKVSFSDKVTVNGAELAKGEYALLTIPGASSWTVNLYPYEARSWSTYKDKEPTLSFNASPMKLPMAYETFTIGFSSFTDASGKMVIAWDNVAIDMTIGVGTDETVMSSIEKVMAGPSNNDYYNAASYFHSTGKDLKQALEWIQKATKVESPKFWQVRRESLILADLGMYNEAIEAANLSKDLAQTAGNEEYVKMNTKSITEWMSKK